MIRKTTVCAAAAALVALWPGNGSATTRDIADMQPVRLAFSQSVLNQLTHGTYRDPFDELQTRPYNLLFTNIGRHANLSPWQGQEGGYTRYFNGLIGNNGAANVDNDADAVQGALIRRENPGLGWGVSAAYLAGTDGSDDANGVSTFADTDDLTGFDLRAAAGKQLSGNLALGAGVRVTQATAELRDRSFEQGVGGFDGRDTFDHLGLRFDVGIRRFHGERSSWETGLVLGYGSSEQDDSSDTLDSTAEVTDRFVVTNYDIGEISVGVFAGYNRLRANRPGEIEFRVGLERTQRELDNNDLSFSDNSGTITPNLTLLDQNAIATTRIDVSARSVFRAGETEVFTGAEAGYEMVDGATRVDASGIVVNEAVDDSRIELGLTVGLRQSLLRDRLRFVVSGRADLTNEERSTIFDTGLDSDDTSLSSARYAIGLEGVLANVTFDLAWVRGQEAPVVPVPLGLPAGSRRTVELDGLVFSAAVSW